MQDAYLNSEHLIRKPSPLLAFSRVQWIRLFCCSYFHGPSITFLVPYRYAFRKTIKSLRSHIWNQHWFLLTMHQSMKKRIKEKNLYSNYAVKNKSVRIDLLHSSSYYSLSYSYILYIYILYMYTDFIHARKCTHTFSLELCKF